MSHHVRLSARHRHGRVNNTRYAGGAPIEPHAVRFMEQDMKKLILETTAPFQGLPELVAYDEGLFAKEGLEIEWAARDDVEKKAEINVTSPKGLDPFSSHGSLLEQGRADMYNACEGGNYCRIQDTKKGSRKIRR